MTNNFDINNLKKSWNEQETPRPFTKEELRLMLNKKSSHNIKYIIVISVIEISIVLLTLIFSTYFPDNKILNNLDPQEQKVYLRNFKINQILSYINITVSIGFIYLFYKCYKRINILNSPKDFIQNIITFKKNVNRFIVINIFTGLINLFLTGFFEFTSEVNKSSFSFSKNIFVFTAICFLIILLAIIYYTIVYGILLRRLRKNLKEFKSQFKF